MIADVGIDQNIGAVLPRDVPMVDDAGRRVLFGEEIGGRPAVLVFVSYKCQMLCPMLLNHLVLAMNGTSLRAGLDYDVIAISLDPRETASDAAQKKEDCLQQYGRGSHVGDAIAGHGDKIGQGWHFLTGSADSIERLERTAGFRTRFDARSGLYAHAAAVIFLSPRGDITHYIYGADFAPSELRQGLDDAAVDRVTRVADPQQVYCAPYDPTRAHFGAIVIWTLRGLAVAMLLALGMYIGLMIRRDLRRPALLPDTPHSSEGAS